MSDTKAPKETQFFNFGQDFKIATFEECLFRYGTLIYNDGLKTLSGQADTNTPNQYKSKFFFKPFSNTGKLAIQKRFQPVIINYIKKYQYPDITNTQTRKKCIENNIFLAPNRVLLQILVGLKSENKNEAYLTQDEAFYFVYLRAVKMDMSKPDIDEIVQEILEGRSRNKNYNALEEITNYWNQPARQYPESVVRILAYTKLISYDENNTIFLNDKLTEELKSYLFEIITYKKLIKEVIPDSEYLDYMDISEEELKQINREFVEQKTTYSGLPLNRIIFGAPGTGKSYQINKDAKTFGANYERVTFHPNYSYAQFVGTYKPTMKINKNESLGDYEKEVIKILSDETVTASEKYKKLYQSGINISALCALIGLATGETDFSTIRTDGTISEKDHTLMSGIGRNMNSYAVLKSIEEDSEITYSYVPGPFIRVLEKALYSQQIGTNEPYLLIIEEINRANVAAVFGDVFQLLDRNEHNESQYEIDVSEDLYNYLTSEDNEQTGHKKLNIGKKLKIPSNMYIWATMNSADQGVQPMDAAFKRRWDFEYLPLDENEKEIANYQLPFPEKDNGYQLRYWKEVRSTINELLKKIGNVNEDKLLGPFFISKNILEKYDKQLETAVAKEFVSLFKSKVLMYLYEDVCKINPSIVYKNVNSKNGTGKTHFSDVCKTFDEIGIDIFKE